MEFKQVQDAASRIKPHANRTPVLTSSYFNSLCGGELFFKCENFQKIGAFKFRGACNAVLSLSDDEAKRGVLTHSSGNHAQALALAAKIRGIEATIVMPENAPKVKVNAVRDYSAKIIFCESTAEAREEAAEKEQKKSGATFIHPYDNEKIIAGQGTSALELLEEVKNLDIVLAPVGGGGLLAGTALAAHSKAKVIAAEPKNADDAQQSFKAGKIIPCVAPNTIADGLRTSLGVLNFEIIKEMVHDVVTVTEDEIIEAMKAVWQRMKIIIEPSSAVPVAAALKKLDLKGKRVGIIISGGNVELDELPWL